MTLGYLYSKFFKIVLRGKSVLNSQIDKTAKIYSGTEFYDSSIGRHSYVGYDSEVHSCDIGSFCSIANGFVVGGAKHPLDWVSTSPIFYNVRGGSGSHLGNLEIEPLKRSTIGHDVWIGNRVTVMQGVNVGIGAVIGAGSVVIEEVPPNCTVVGVPGRIVRMGDQKVPSADLDQIHLPDPVLNDIRQLQTDNIRLKKELKALKEKLAKEKIIEEA